MKDQKIALVTGSSKGIGAGIAKILGANGYTVVVTYKSDLKGATSTVNAIQRNGTALSMQLDVTSEESVMSAMKTIAKKYGQLNVLVNNSGVDHFGPIEMCSFEQWQAITRSKIDGNFLCTKYALPLLKKAGKADVICIMSGLGDRPDPEDPAYSVGTAGVVAFVKAMAMALGKYGIRVNGVGPGGVRTNIAYYKEASLDSDKTWEKFAKENPLGRTATPNDVGQTVFEVIENKSQFWNGNFVYVSGGEHLK